MKNFFQLYLDSYRGLSQPAWMLALVIFINRSGAMVLPFLAVYMTKSLHFSLGESGFVLSCFGIGAAIGSWLGGQLTDRIGHFKVQISSLLFSVPVFCFLPLFKTVETLAIGIFCLSIITDTFRPANSVSVSYYAKPENITKAFSLNRMAINLGFSVGPALGGLLAVISYNWLFYGNAITAAVAAILFYFYFRNREGNEQALQKKGVDIDQNKKIRSPYRDRQFILFNVLCALYSICFFQWLNTLPLFYEKIHNLNEGEIGLILGFSGIVVFSLEMLLVHIAERKMSARQVIVLGAFFCGISFAMLTVDEGKLILYASMFVLCISEILVLPFIATVTVKRSVKENRGAYMGLGSFSFALSYIISPYFGTKIASNYGFDVLWWGTAMVSTVSAIGFYYVMKKM